MPSRLSFNYIINSKNLTPRSIQEKHLSFLHFPFSFLVQFSSVQFSHSVVSDPLRHHESQHTRLPCPPPSPGSLVPLPFLNSCTSSLWCHPAISSSVIPFFSCLQSFPASGLDSQRARINMVNGITVLWQEPGTCLSNRQGREHGYQCSRLITRGAKLREFPLVYIHFLNEIWSEAAPEKVRIVVALEGGGGFGWRVRKPA